MTPLEGAGLFAVGAVTSGINAVAGGGSLISFPVLTVLLRIPELPANATNSVGLWPGSLAGGLGFRNLFERTGRYLKALALPTVLGSTAGAFLLLNTSNETFRRVIPVLVLLAATLLLFQPQIKRLAGLGGRTLPLWAGVVLQFLVSVYGGYFGAGIGIMMLACFALYIEGNVHELNAVKNWLSVIVNFVCSAVFLVGRPRPGVMPPNESSIGLVLVGPAVALVLGALVGGYVAARVSQRFNPDRLRRAIAIYGLAMAAYFAHVAYF